MYYLVIKFQWRYMAHVKSMSYQLNNSCYNIHMKSMYIQLELWSYKDTVTIKKYMDTNSWLERKVNTNQLSNQSSLYLSKRFIYLQSKWTLHLKDAAVDFVNCECHQILLPNWFNTRQTVIRIEGYSINLIECKVGAS
jgi:hypothetical protein